MSIKILTYPDEATALAVSRQMMLDRQDEKTRNDPKSTLYAYQVSTNDETGRSSLIIPDSAKELNRFSLSDKNSMKTEEEAVLNKDMKEPILDQQKVQGKAK